CRRRARGSPFVSHQTNLWRSRFASETGSHKWGTGARSAEGSSLSSPDCGTAPCMLPAEGKGKNCARSEFAPTLTVGEPRRLTLCLVAFVRPGAATSAARASATTLVPPSGYHYHSARR